MYEVLLLALVVLFSLLLSFAAFLWKKVESLDLQLRQFRPVLIDLTLKVEALTSRNRERRPLSEGAESTSAVAAEQAVSSVAAEQTVSSVAAEQTVSPSVLSVPRTQEPSATTPFAATDARLADLVPGLARRGSTVSGPVAKEPFSATRPRAWSEVGIREFEQRAGQRWMTWIGALALLVGVLFLIKYCFDHGWIGPTARLTVGMLVGVALMAGGEWAVRRRYLPFAQGLLAAGLSICHASLFAAYRFHDLIPQPVAFGGMVTLTIVGMALAVFHDFLAFAILAIIGGFLAPVLLSTGRDGRDMLFSYVLLLDLGVLCALLGRKWRWLDGVAFLASATLYLLWHDEYYRPEGLAPALVWLSVLYLVFVAAPTLTLWRHGGPFPPERLLLVVSNAVFFLAMVGVLLHRDHASSIAGVACLMAALYAAIGWRTHARFPAEHEFLLTMTALAVALVTIAIPIYFDLNAITLLWAIEGPILVYLGYVYGYAPLRRLAIAVLVLTVPLGLDHLDRILNAPEYLPLLHGEFWSAIMLPLGAILFAWMHDRFSLKQDAWDRIVTPAAAIIGGVGLLLFIHVDVDRYLDRLGRDGGSDAFWNLKRASFAVILWSMGAVLFEVAGSIKQSTTGRAAGVLLSIFAGLGALSWLFEPVRLELVPVFNPRFSACAFSASALLVIAWLRNRDPRLRVSPEQRVAVPLLSVEAMVLFWALFSMEAYEFSFSRWGYNVWGYRAALASVSVVWASYATVLLAIGFGRRWRWLRLTALGLFGLTACKLLVLDLAGLRDLSRIAAFFGLGLLMIASSYLYHRLEKRLDAPASE